MFMIDCVTLDQDTGYKYSDDTVADARAIVECAIEAANDHGNQARVYLYNHNSGAEIDCGGAADMTLDIAQDCLTAANKV